MLNENPQITETNETPQEKHYIEAGFKEGEYGQVYYEVQWKEWENITSIVLEILNRNKDNMLWDWITIDEHKVANIGLAFLKKELNKDPLEIKKWDEIKVESGDNNNIFLHIWQNLYSINPQTKEISQLSEKKGG